MLQAAFVNTDDEPLDIKRQGVFKSAKYGNNTIFYELCEVWYPHPDAPSEARISLLTWREVTANQGTENLILFTIAAMQDIKNISVLA